MAISDSSKVDLLYKKLFGVAKTDTPTNKSPSNEAIASPHLTRGDQIWQQSANIPAIASAVTDIVQAYLTTDRIECVADNTSTPVNGVFPSWKTNLIDWIPSEFGSAYFVKVYAESPGNPDPTSGTPLSDSGIGGIGEWNFDYQSGVLNFIGGTIPAALTSDKVIYITGYRYIGLKGVSAFGNVTFGNISVTGNIFGNLISGNSYITSTEVKLQDISVAGNVISSLTTDLVFSANVTDPNNIIRFDSVSALDIPAGTTAQRPPNPDPGYVRYNSDITTIEWWNGTEWTAGSRLIEAETITPDGINQTFTLGQNTLPEGILVNINGTIQQAMSGAYTIVGDQITFSEIPEITDIIEIRYLSAGMTSASWYGGTIVNPVNITAITPTTSAATGALVVHGGVGFGSNLTIAGNIIPAANTTYSLGDADHWWKSLYVSSNTIYINGIPLSVQADGTLLVNNAPVSSSGSTYANSNVAAYLTSQSITSANIGTLFNGNASTQANLGAFQTYANANIGVLYNGNVTTNANIGAYQTWANANAATQATAINSIDANLGAYQTYANATFSVSSYGNSNVESYIGANIGAYQTWANANAATQAAAINSINSNVTAANAAIQTLSANIGTLVAGAPGALDTLVELGNALGNSDSFSATMVTWLGNITSNITASNASINTLNANVGSFYTWANANFGTSSYSNTNVAAYLVANPQGSTYSNTNVAAYLTSQNITSANIGAYQTWANSNFGTSTYSNTTVEAYFGANIGTLFNGNASTNANLGAFQLYANANIGTLFNGNASTNANLGAFQTYANANIGTLFNGNASTNANLGAFQLYANANIGTLYNGNVSTNANLGAYQTWANANAATQAASINSLATGANTNTAAYLTTATITTTGNITAGNFITSGATSGNITNVNVISANSLQLNANLTISGNGTIGTNLYVYGNLQVSGTTTTVNQATLSVTDKIITVSNGSINSTQANGAGLSVAGASANIVYTSVGDQWNSNKPFYATALYDNSVRVVSTSSGAGNLTVTAGAVNLTATGPGAVTTGSATAIPVITTDAYGRISAISTASVSSTLNTAGTSGTGTINLTSQSLTVTGTNGITAAASGQTVTVTDNLWPAANANIGTLFNGNTSTNANLGAFQLYANANIGVLYNGNTSTNANLGAFQTYANANIGVLYNGNISTNANLGAYQTYANANAATQATSINTINANIGAYQIYANANIGVLYNGNVSTNANLGAFQLYANANIGTLFNGNTSTNANLGAFQLYANANIGTLFNGNTSTNANLGAYQTWANANVAGLQTSITSLRTNANTNTAAYLAAGISTNVTTTGNITAGNVLINGALTSYGVVNPAFIVVGLTSSVTSFGLGSTFVLDTVVGNINSQTSYNTSTGVFTLTAGVTYDMSFTPSFITFSNTTGGYMCYEWVDATANTPLDSTGTGIGTTLPVTEISGQNDNPTARVIYTPSTNQTVKLRVTSALGTATLRGGIGTQAIVRPLNLSVAVQATATGTVNNDYIQAGRITSAQTVSNAATPQDVIFNTSIATNSGIAHNASTGVFTLTAGKTYELEAQLTYTGMNSTGDYILFNWVDATTNALLDTTGISTGTVVPATWASNAAYGTLSKLVYTPSTNQTVKVRITAGLGSGTIMAGQGTYAKITQINQAFALNSIKDLTVGTANTAGNLNVYGNITYNGAQVTTGNISTTVVSNTSPVTTSTNGGSNTSPGLTVLTLAIPSAGTWRLDAELRVSCGTGGYVAVAFYDNGTLIPNSEYWLAGGATNNSNAGSSQYGGFMSYNLTTTGARTVTVGIWSTSSAAMIDSGDGRTWARATQLDPSFTLSNQVAVGGNLTVGGNLNVTGTSTSLVTKASGLVNAGVDVTLGNLRARMSTGGNRSLQLSTVSGTYSVYGSGVYSYGGVSGSTIDVNSPRAISTTPAYIAPGYTFGTAGATDTWLLMDTTNTIAWRITLIVGASYNNNLITIERLL